MDDQLPQLQQDPQKTAAQEAYRRELERRSLDSIKIFNPLEEEYICYWDGYGNRFPSHRESIYPRYIAEKAMKEIIDKILTDKAEHDIKEINRKRMDNGQQRLTPQERWEIESSIEYKISEKSLRRPLVKQIWKGIEKEYGMDMIPALAEKKNIDSRPVDEQLIDEIDHMSLLQDEEEVQSSLIKGDYIEDEGMVAEQPRTVEPTQTTDDIPEEKGVQHGRAKATK